MSENVLEKGCVSHHEGENIKGSIVSDDSHHKSQRERRLVLKQDLAILPLVSVMFFFAYVDRGQIGNARIMGMEHDLGLTDGQFYNCLMMFFVGYMVFELPALLGLRIFKPAYLYGLAVVVFGTLAACIAACNGYASLLIIRFLLGFAEACAQTVFVFLSLWYKRDEIATRSCLFYLSAPTAGAVSGLIAYGVDKNLDGVHGLHSWQWLFIVEGVPTIAWGILIVFCLPSLPETVAEKGTILFHDKEEHNLILKRTVAGQNTVNAKIEPIQIWIGLKDPKTWLGALIAAATFVGVAAFTTFLPTFISVFGFPRLQTQLYSIIPYAFAAVSMCIMSVLSDRLGRKAMPLLACLITSMTGLVLLMATTNRVALIAGACFVAAGAYPGVVLAASWIATTHAGYTKRCTALAVAQIFGQSWSIVGTQVYTTPPRYLKGHGTLLGLFSLACLCVLVNYWMMKRENTLKDTVAERFRLHGEGNPDSVKSLEELCNSHPDYRYVL